VLAKATWEFESSTSYSIGADSGAWVLTRIGPRYIVYSINGHEYDRENLDAPDDESAVATFRSMMTGD